MNLPHRFARVVNSVLLSFLLTTNTLFATVSRAQEKPIDPMAFLRKPDVEAEVRRGTDNELTIHWSLPARSVEIFSGTRPDAIDHTKPVAHVQSKQEVILRDLTPSERFYFDLKFTGGALNGKTLTVAERFVPFKGAANFRDLGGYPTINGKHVRWGLVFRSEGLSKLTHSDLEYLSDNLRLHLVGDLRGPSELAAAPDHLPETNRPETINLPIDSNSGALRNLLPVVLKGDPAAIDDLMAQGYIEMVDTKGSTVFGPLLTRFADSKNLPSVFHCTAGKDRTGIATVLLLTLLGIPRQTVIAEYSLSNLAYDALLAELKDNKALLASGLDPQRLAPLLVVKPIWMERTLDHIQEKYGSVESYLKTAAHLDDATLAQIRVNLLQ